MNYLYPDTISLEGEKLDFLRKHSELIRTLYEIQGNEGPLEVSAELLFPSDEDKQEQWELFYDLFFPEEGIKKVFQFSGNTVRVNRERGGKEAVREMLDYMMVDEPNTMMNFAKSQAYKQMNAPSRFIKTQPKEKGKANVLPINLGNNFNNYNNNNYNNDYDNNNNNNNNNTKIGYTEEEEAYLGKLKGSTAQQYYRNERRTRNRRTRKVNRKSRKATRRNRR